MVSNTKRRSYLSCNSDCNRWIKSHYGQYEEFVERHHWKILLASIAFLGLCWLGFKSMDFEKDLMKLWIYNSSRLHNETSYLPRYIDGGSIETIIQVSKEDILSPSFLLEHLQLLSAIVKLEIKYDNKIFTLRSFCRQIQLPRMHYLDHYVRQMIESLMPCEIVSPLNCFWEGSKLLNDENRMDPTLSRNINWSTFDFQVILNSFKNTTYQEFFETLLNETDIDRGYISKPCIEPSNPECSNKAKPIIVNTVLKHGCYQLAKNLYHYPRSVLVGENNRAFQSLIFLRSAAHVLKTMMTSDLDWTEEKVQHVITLWQTKLRQTVIQYNKQRPYLKSNTFNNFAFQSKRTEKSNFYTFTNNSLSDAFDNTESDETMMARYLISVGLVMLWIVILFLCSNDPVRSHCWLAIAGTLLVIVSVISGLGLSAAVGLKFSVLTIQVIPFIMLGLGVDDVIILTTCYVRSLDHCAAQGSTVHPVHQTLHDCATLMLLSFLVKMAVVGGTAFIPVPLMRNFCEQVLLIIVFQTGATVFVYPCLLYLDSLRQHNHRVDILCCLVKHGSADPTDPTQTHSSMYDESLSGSEVTTSQVIFSTEFTTSLGDLVPDNVRQYVEINPISSVVPSQGRPSSRAHTVKPKQAQRSQFCCSFRYSFSNTFIHIIALAPVHITIVLVTIIVIVISIYSAININCGLNFESIFIRDSNEYNYVKYESTEFRLHNFYILTTDIDYVNYQHLVLQLNDDIKSVSNVEMFGNGKFWLSCMIRWLERLQLDLDSDVRRRFILSNGSWSRNASKNGLIAMTLLVQDQDSINFKRLTTARLVRSRLIDESHFYLYLNVWRSVSYDYDTIPCLLYPEMQPFNVDNFIPNAERTTPLVIRMSGRNLFDNNPLKFVACKYFYRGITDKEKLAFVHTIRTVANTFSAKGVTSVPLGHIFSLSEQYFSLKYHLVIAVIASLCTVFLVTLVTLNHLLISLAICLILVSNIFGVFLFASVYQLPLNSTSGMMALWSGGLGLRFSLYVIISYAQHSGGSDFSQTTAEGTLDHKWYSHLAIRKQLQARMQRAIHVSPCMSVLSVTVLSSVLISMTNVTFIWQHFLLLPMIGVVHSLFNCYCLTPVLCFYMLPQAPIMSSNIDPPPRPISSSRSYRSHFRPRKSRTNLDHRYTFDIDHYLQHSKLSTIVEESASLNSSTRSHASQENVHQMPSSSSSSNLSQFIEQHVQSSLTMQYPVSTTVISNPTLSLQTSFKYRTPINPGP